MISERLSVIEDVRCKILKDRDRSEDRSQKPGVRISKNIQNTTNTKGTKNTKGKKLWNDGILECWKNGMMQDTICR